MAELLWCGTAVVSAAAIAAWVADQVPDGWIDAMVRRLW